MEINKSSLVHLLNLNCTLAFSELPVNIVKPLQDKTALEKSRVILDCTVSNPRCSIRWYKGSNVILPSERFEICSEGCYRKLILQQVALDDEGMYSVQVGEYTCSAKLTVEGKRVHDQLTSTAQVTAKLLFSQPLVFFANLLYNIISVIQYNLSDYKKLSIDMYILYYCSCYWYVCVYMY